MSRRTITSFKNSTELLDCLISIFSLEIYRPSKEIYIVSPWISNCTIIDNSSRRFSSLFPFVSTKNIRLADILFAFVSNGSKVRIITTFENKETVEFVNLVRNKIECRVLKDNHEKGMITDNYYLSGSMNFTYKGINVNSESVTVSSDESDIGKALVSIRSKWEESDNL